MIIYKNKVKKKLNKFLFRKKTKTQQQKIVLSLKIILK